jgi:outer membrane protein
MNLLNACLKLKLNCLYKIFIMCMIAVTGAVLPAINGLAQDLDMYSPEIFSLKQSIVGLGGGLAPDYEGSDEYTGIVIPQFRYNWGNGCFVNLLGPSLRANLIPSRAFGFGPMLRYQPGRDSVDDNAVDKFKKIDSALDAGVFGNVVFNNFILYAAFNADTTDAYGGYLFDVAGGYRVGIESNVQFIVLALGTYASDDYMETYFGIDEENSERSGLPQYSAGAGVKDIGLMGALQYRIDSSWAIFGIMKYTRLIGDAADSPIVDQCGDANNFMDGIIFNYSFN